MFVSKKFTIFYNTYFSCIYSKELSTLLYYSPKQNYTHKFLKVVILILESSVLFRTVKLSSAYKTNLGTAEEHTAWNYLHLSSDSSSCSLQQRSLKNQCGLETLCGFQGPDGLILPLPNCKKLIIPSNVNANGQDMKQHLTERYLDKWLKRLQETQSNLNHLV